MNIFELTNKLVDYSTKTSDNFVSKPMKTKKRSKSKERMKKQSRRSNRR